MSAKDLTVNGMNIRLARGLRRFGDILQPGVLEQVGAFGYMELLMFLLRLAQEWRRAAGERTTLWSILKPEPGDIRWRKGSELMYTLTADGRQLQCWFGMPGQPTRECVGEIPDDETGDVHPDGELYSIEGDAGDVAYYVRMLVPATMPSSRGPMQDKIGTTYWF